MGFSHSVRVFRAGVALGIKQAWQEKITILGSLIIYGTIMLLYGGVIKMIPDADLAKHGYSHSQMIWYLAITEYVLFICASWGFKEVQNDFQSEQIYLSLLRPYRASLVRISVWAGEALVRAAGMFVPVMLFITWLAGGLQMSALQVIGMLLSIPLSAVMMLAGLYIIGASCLWFVQSEPAYWIWNKSIFLLGALLWPMAYYPVMMQNIMWSTPFPAILAQAGEWALDPSLTRILLGFVHQLFWCLVAVFVLRWFDGVVLRKIQSGEGV
ncbi:MAG TPA: hypothetical protein DCY07_03550 [Rhodospirillaceae bacterium]|nr:hypothetical protein [Rhodospirillaceae bacterium]